MNKWKCNNCETINDIENHVCEVCEGKAPYISKFEYKIDEKLGIAECYWIANDYNCLFCQLNDGVLFEPQGNNYTFNVCEHNIIRIIVENEITRVTYDYLINVPNISVDNKIMTQNNIRAERTADNIKKKKAKEEFYSLIEKNHSLSENFSGITSLLNKKEELYNYETFINFSSAKHNQSQHFRTSHNRGINRYHRGFPIHYYR